MDKRRYIPILAGKGRAALSLATALGLFLFLSCPDRSLQLPAFLAQPEDALVQIGRDAAFSVTVEASGQPGYQWQRDGVDIPGAVSPTYIVKRVTLEDSGSSFSCVASDAGGSLRSRSAVLTVTALAGILRTYYIDYGSGSDANEGTKDHPWKRAPGDRNATGLAAAAVLLPGDTLSFRAGVVYRGCIKARASGSEGSPITYSGMGWGTGRAIMEPPENPAGALHEADGFEVFGDEVCIGGFLFRNYPEYAVEIRQDADARGVAVLDCEASDCGSGVMMGGSDCLTRGCHFHDMKMIVNDAEADNDYGAIGVWIAGRGNRALDNRMVRCLAPSQDYGNDGGAVELFGTVDGSQVMRNQAFGCNGFLEAGSGGSGSARDITVAYNLSVDNGPFCILHGGGTFALEVEDFRIDNNTIVEDTAARAPASWSNWAMLAFPGIQDPLAVRVRNNIFWIRDTQWICPAETEGYRFTRERNLYYLASPGSRLGFSPVSGEIEADPLFLDLEADGFELVPTSPARNAGALLGYAEDLLGRPVPSASRPALGAFQSP